jgi:hypothetical protein
MTYAEFIKRPDLDKWQAIVKTLVDGRRQLLGFERKSKQSRKYATKLWIRPPVILDEIVAAHKTQENP